MQQKLVASIFYFFPPQKPQFVVGAAPFKTGLYYKFRISDDCIFNIKPRPLQQCFFYFCLQPRFIYKLIVNFSILGSTFFCKRRESFKMQGMQIEARLMSNVCQHTCSICTLHGLRASPTLTFATLTNHAFD